MSSTIRGSTVSWGCLAETGGLIQNFEVDDKVDEVEVRNHEGEVAVHITYNRFKEFSGEFYPTSSANIGAIAPAALYSFANLSDSASKIVTSVKTTNENTNAKRMQFSGKIYPLVTN